MYFIDSQNCTGCEKCLEVCPAGAIYMVDKKAQIDEGQCTECSACVRVCPNNAIKPAQTSIQKSAADEAHLPKQPVMSAIKSAAMALGSTLASIGISKLGDLLISKLESSSRTPSTTWRTSSPKSSNTLRMGRGSRKRFRRGGRRRC